MTQTASHSGRLIIVSNRLPITIKREDDVYSYNESAGGLTTGVMTYLRKRKTAKPGSDENRLWIGWPGMPIPNADREQVTKTLREDYGAVPVNLTRKQGEDFYLGICNNTLWPLFHYFYVFATFDADQWQAYEETNRIFCDEVARVIRPGDTVWVHDYHLMLLPGMLRERFPQLRIGFFLHIPFPAYEIFRLLPRHWARALLRGVLGADLVGFHTHDYAQYYLRCVLRLLGIDHTLGTVQLEDRVVRVETFPMGIDFDRFAEISESQAVTEAKEDLLSSLQGRRAILSVDRLDYTKGIATRLEAYECFLEEHPEWRGKVTLVAIVVPSREAVAQYDAMKQRIDQLVGTINGRFGSHNWTPILYQYRQLSIEPLVAAYAVSDVALVTPLRDGMNLIAKEYVASRTDEQGVLILSEMAGAASELGEAVIINPNNKHEIVEAIHTALTMEPEEQRRRMRGMRHRLHVYNVVRWAEDFLTTLEATWGERHHYERIIVAGDLRRQLVDAYRSAKQRLILTDYDGTLVGFYGDPLMAKPREWLLSILTKLAEQEKTKVALVSGRVKNNLEEWLGSLDVGLVAEHGAYIREPGEEWKTPVNIDASWKDQLRPIFQMASDRLPGSFVEEKDFSLVWHYRMSNPELAPQRARELSDMLTQFTANINIQVLQGARVVEVRNGRVNKGLGAEYFMDYVKPDFVLAVGDDWTDEDLFRALPEWAWTVKVGLARSHARFALHNHKEVVELLEELSQSPPHP